MLNVNRPNGLIRNLSGSSDLTKHSIEDLARSSAAAAAAAASYSAAAAAASWGYFYPYGSSLVSAYGVSGLQAQNGGLPIAKLPNQPFQTLRCVKKPGVSLSNSEQQISCLGSENLPLPPPKKKNMEK